MVSTKTNFFCGKININMLHNSAGNTNKFRFSYITMGKVQYDSFVYVERKQILDI